ncbi:putative E3 ubiquitin-protein ligase HERC2-like [Apostichopus japonicus]|uniref:Putative E3 ubiquitin-protein ligase HERC2-like n=1 Tax=Stichopus japonicus TaxID=307972 RepID=A0A2G8L200_STIJA|nr:putative E3 ubiquitin-protein ligase HERC2-like [Apostichopus japonicus]
MERLIRMSSGNESLITTVVPGRQDHNSKWLKTDLQAVFNREGLSKYWNQLVKDGEVTSDKAELRFNLSPGKGRTNATCSCVNVGSGLNSSCSCISCQQGRMERTADLTCSHRCASWNHGNGATNQVDLDDLISVPTTKLSSVGYPTILFASNFKLNDHQCPTELVK